MAHLPQHVLLVDDDPLLRRSLAWTLTQAGFRTSAHASAEEALAALESDPPDLVLLDIGLPGMDGLEALRLLHQRMDVPVVFVTARRRELEQVLGLELGADDYVTKPFSIAEVVARVNAHVRRSKRFETTESNYVFGPYTLDVKGQVLRKDGNQLELSQKEFQMLKLFLENEGKVLSRQEILTKVWGFDYFGTDRTVDNFINKLRQKVEGDINRPEHILTMRGSGYKFLR